MVCARASTSVPRFASVGTRPGFPASCPNDRPVPASRAADYFGLRTAHRIIGAMVGRRFPGSVSRTPCTASPCSSPPRRSPWLSTRVGSSCTSWTTRRRATRSASRERAAAKDPRRRNRPKNRRHTAACRPRDGAPNPSLRTTPSESRRVPGGADWETFLQAAHITVPLRRDPPTRNDRRFESHYRERTQISAAVDVPSHARRASTLRGIRGSARAGVDAHDGDQVRRGFSRVPGRPHGVPREFHRARVRGERGSARVDVTGGGALCRTARGKNLVLASAAEPRLRARADGEEARVRCERRPRDDAGRGAEFEQGESRVRRDDRQSARLGHVVSACVSLIVLRARGERLHGGGVFVQLPEGALQLGVTELRRCLGRVPGHLNSPGGGDARVDLVHASCLPYASVAAFDEAEPVLAARPCAAASSASPARGARASPSSLTPPAGRGTPSRRPRAARSAPPRASRPERMPPPRRRSFHRRGAHRGVVRAASSREQVRAAQSRVVVFRRTV